MNRRQALRYLVAGIGVGGAGCSGFAGSSSDNNDDQTNQNAQAEDRDTTTEPPEETETETESRETTVVSAPRRPGRAFEGAPPVPEGRHGPYELDFNNEREHYFSVDLQEGDELTVTMYFTHSAGDLDMSVHTESFDYNKVGSSGSTTDNESVSHTASRSETHYIKTFIVSLDRTNTYELEVEIQ